MIVVIGVPAWRSAAGKGSPARAVGRAVDVARAAVAAGSTVELVGKVGEDPAGDALLLDLAAAGIVHAALLRDPAFPTRAEPGPPRPEPLDDDTAAIELTSLLGSVQASSETAGPDGRRAPVEAGLGPSLDAADIDLALRYLADQRVLVAADPLDERSTVVLADAASFAGAQVVALIPAGTSGPAVLAGATVLEVADADPGGDFAGLVGAYAAALDRGEDPDRAFHEATAARGWEPVGRADPTA